MDIFKDPTLKQKSGWRPWSSLRQDIQDGPKQVVLSQVLVLGVCFSIIKNKRDKATEMVQQLRAMAVLPRDLGSIFSIHTAAYTSVIQFQGI